MDGRGSAPAPQASPSFAPIPQACATPTTCVVPSNPWHKPLFEPTYRMNESTIVEPCNSSGWSDASFFAKFGVVNYDWSNAKAEWSAAKPMDCQERLVTQAKMTKAANPTRTLLQKPAVGGGEQ